MPDGMNVVLATEGGQTVMKPKPEWVPPKSKKEARNRLTQELLVALRARPEDFRAGERRQGLVYQLVDTRSGMTWLIDYSRTSLLHVQGCGCTGLRLGFRNGWKIESAVDDWDKARNPKRYEPPHVHEAKRLWLANNPEAT